MKKWNVERQSLLLFGWLLLATPVAVRAQFNFAVVNGSVTITYTWSTGAVVIPDTISGMPVTAIGDSAFGGCTNLTSVTIPDSVTNIGNGAFYYCPSLTSVIIPDSVTSIGTDVFADCISLTNITIPNGVTSIGSSTFFYCTNLTTIDVATNNLAYSSVGGVLFDKSQATLIEYPGGKHGSYSIPNSVTNIGNAAFASCPRLTNVTMGNSVTSIGANGFGACSSLINVTIGNGVTSIGDDAFQYCTSLTNMTIGNSVTNIGGWAFNGCSSLTSITIPTSVTSIGNMAFSLCANLASVPIPNSVTSIGTEAFAFCTSLTNMTIGNSVTNIGASAFASCNRLTDVTIPNSVTSIGDQAFSNCSSLTNVTIGNSVTTIGAETFSQCYNLTNITIPASVTNIRGGTFLDCTNLTAINVETNNPAYSSVDGVLFNQRQTTLLEYPSGKVDSHYSILNSVTNIGDTSFASCSSLSSVTIPESVTYIGSLAFSSCSSLATVFFRGNAPYAEIFSPWPGNRPYFVFNGDTATAYYLPGTIGWSTNYYGGIPTTLWSLPFPLILNGSLGVHTNGFGFTVSWATNLSVVVEVSPDLTNPKWSPVATNALNKGVVNFNDSDWTNYPSRFYRVRSQ
jgi:hypothetical protein